MSTTHVSQRIGNCLRLGGSQDIQLERFVEALYNEKSGLTYPALTGVRKQSVEDVEHLFGAGVVRRITTQWRSMSGWYATGDGYWMSVASVQHRDNSTERICCALS